MCDVTTVDRDPATGLYRKIEKTVIPADMGPERYYTLRRHTRERLIEIIDEEISKGVVFSPSPSMDQRRLVTEAENEGGY